jgi:hypothetical protein
MKQTIKLNFEKRLQNIDSIIFYDNITGEYKFFSKLISYDPKTKTNTHLEEFDIVIDTYTEDNKLEMYLSNNLMNPTEINFKNKSKSFILKQYSNKYYLCLNSEDYNFKFIKSITIKYTELEDVIYDIYQVSLDNENIIYLPKYKNKIPSKSAETIKYLVKNLNFNISETQFDNLINKLKTDKEYKRNFNSLFRENKINEILDED